MGEGPRGGAAARMRLLAPLLAWLAGCGLEAGIPVLNAPSGSGDTLAATLQITTATETDADVQANITNYGLELYYRFYPDIGSVNASLSTQNDLLANGFRRMSKPTDTNSQVIRPLILDPTPGTSSSVAT